MSIRIDGTNTTANPGITGGDADTGLQFGTDEIQFVTGGTNRATVESNGNFTIESGNLILASGGGIDFSATADGSGMTGEVLDDYEEGTWTPAFYNNTNGSATLVNFAEYKKIGNTVYFNCYIALTTNSSITENILIDGLPFTAKSGDHYGGVIVPFFLNFSSNLTYLAGTVQTNATNILLRGLTSADTSTFNLSSINIAAGAQIILSGFYFV